MVYQSLKRSALRSLVVWVLPAFVLVSPPAPASVRDSASVVSELRRLEWEFGGHLGIAARNLATGETIRYRAAERFPTASAIKFPVMGAYFRELSRKKVDPSLRFELVKSDKKPGSGVLQYLRDGLPITLADAVTLMIILSDNTATNLVLDHLATTHEARLRVVNDFLDDNGLPATRLLNRIYSLPTKKNTPDAVRFGIGVSTPDDMVTLFERLYRHTLVDSVSSDAMLSILMNQQDFDMLPRLLPALTCKRLDIAHKTGSVSEVKVDVGLVLSDRASFAVAIFVEKSPDHREGEENRGTLLAAHAGRAIWNFFTGDTGYSTGDVPAGDVDWTRFPGGIWGIYRTSAAPFPHPNRMQGHTASDSTEYPLFPHYMDSSVVVFVPDGFKEGDRGTNLIVHFHGHMNDNLRAVHRYGMLQALADRKINALLVIPQGPYFARDSFGGKMEDAGGLKRLVDDVLATMKRENIVRDTAIGGIIISAHSGGYRPAAYVLDRGGLNDHVEDVFLFDAFYANQDKFKVWLQGGRGTLFGAYTDHLKAEHLDFERVVKPVVGDRLQFTPTAVEHEDVVQEFLPRWLARLGPEWQQHP